MARVLVVHHTVSPPLDALLQAVLAGAGTDQVEGVEVVTRPALTASPRDVLEADGYVLGTPANLGSMSGALKHFFDTVYYPCLETTGRRPKIQPDPTGGIQFEMVQRPRELDPAAVDLDTCELTRRERTSGRGVLNLAQHPLNRVTFDRHVGSPP